MTLHIAENIRRLRKERGLTQERLSEILGVTVGAVSKWEAGASTPELGLIVEMADFFETSVDVLLGYDWHGGSMGEALERIRALRNEKRFDEASAEAEKALERYPNHFEVAFKSAVMYSLKGMEKRDKKACRRALSLYERSLELIAQNTDEKISAWSIQNYIAEMYLALEQNDKALARMKQNNVDGLNDGLIGYTLATAENKPEEALPFLSSALLDGMAKLMRVTSGLASAYGRLGDCKKGVEVLQWMESLNRGLKPDGVSYMDKMSAQLAAGCAALAAQGGDEPATREFLREARRMAERFDSAPSYSFTNSRYYHGEGMSFAFDDFGGTAIDGIKLTLAEQERGSAMLLDIWEEILHE